MTISAEATRVAAGMPHTRAFLCAADNFCGEWLFCFGRVTIRTG
ncbi:hypothetical protein [Ruminococcus sp.]|nr:hypothetical protein [Ruminococcus sp.]